MPTADNFIRPKEWVSSFVTDMANSISSFENEYLGE